MKSNSLFVILLLVVVSGILPLVSAYDTHKVNTDYNLVINSNNGTNCYITYIGNLTGLNLELTKSYTSFNYTIDSNNFTTLNDVCIGLRCTDGSSNETGSKCLTITASGYIPNVNLSQAGIYFILGLAITFFIGFLFVNNDVYKWSFFLMFIFFSMIGVNLISLSLYNQIGNTSLGAIFDQLSAFSIIFYWFIGGLLLFIWVLTGIAALVDRKHMREAENVGSNTKFKY